MLILVSFQQNVRNFEICNNFSMQGLEPTTEPQRTINSIKTTKSVDPTSNCIGLS